jgi:hypothetical protein
MIWGFSKFLFIGLEGYSGCQKHVPIDLFMFISFVRYFANRCNSKKMKAGPFLTLPFTP